MSAKNTIDISVEINLQDLLSALRRERLFKVDAGSAPKKADTKK